MICLLELSTIFTLTLGVSLVPNYLQDVHGIATGRIGVLGSLAALGAIMLGITINRVRFFHSPLAAIGLAITAVAGTLTFMTMGTSLFMFALGYTMRGGYFVAWSLFAAALGEVTPERFRSRAFAMAEMMGGTGFAFAPFVSGWLYGMEPKSPLIVALALIGPLLLATVYVSRSIRQERPAPALAEERA
jgi:MFS family permease